MAALTHFDELQNMISLGINTDAGSMDLEKILEKMKDVDIEQRESYIKDSEWILGVEKGVRDVAVGQRELMTEMGRDTGKKDKQILRQTETIKKNVERLIEEKYELKRKKLERMRERELKRVREQMGSGDAKSQMKTAEGELERVQKEIAEMNSKRTPS